MWGLLLSLGPKALALLGGPVSQFVTGININQVLSNVLSALAAIIKFIRKHWLLCLIIGLAIGNIIGFTGWERTDQSLKVEQLAHKADIKSYKDAQTKANADARAQEQSIIQESKVKADAADANYSGLLAKYRANLLRYQTNQSGAKSTSQYQDSNQASQTASVSDGSGGSSIIPQRFLTITIDDAQICATNTARLQAAHDWAIKLGEDANAN